MMVHVDHMIGRAIPVIAAGNIKEGRPGPSREPGIKSIDENAIGIVRINRKSLIVPVLVVIAHSAGGQGRSLRTAHERPGGAAIVRGPNSELAAIHTAAAAGVPVNGTDLGINDVRITRGYGDVDSTEVVD